jgi:hypothetical protein
MRFGILLGIRREFHQEEVPDVVRHLHLGTACHAAVTPLRTLTGTTPECSKWCNGSMTGSAQVQMAYDIRHLFLMKFPSDAQQYAKTHAKDPRWMRQQSFPSVILSPRHKTFLSERYREGCALLASPSLLCVCFAVNVAPLEVQFPRAAPRVADRSGSGTTHPEPHSHHQN